MKREGLIILLVSMLVCGLIFTPALSMSNKNSENRISGPRANLIVGPGQTYTTIGDAITAATSGDTIYVYAGTYTEEVVLDKTLTLVGNSSADTIIDSSGANVPLDIKIDNCNVNGFTIRGSGGAATDAGLLINSSFNHILDCIIRDNQGNGIRLESAGSNNTIENCLVTNNSRHGIKIISSNNNLVKICTIIANDEDGINLQNTNSNTFENNSISDSLTASKSSISFM